MRKGFNILIIAIVMILAGCNKAHRGDDYSVLTEDHLIDKMYANPDSAIAYIDEYVAADSISPEHGIYMRALYYHYLTETPESAIELIKALDRYFEKSKGDNLEDRAIRTGYLILAAKVFKLSDHYSYALHYAEKAAEYCRDESFKNHSIASDMDCIIGNILFTMGREDEGFSIINDAIAETDTCHNFIDRQAHLNCHIQQLTLLYEIDSCDEMLAICDNCLEDIRNIGKSNNIPVIYHDDEALDDFKDFHTGIFLAYRSSAFARLGMLDSAQTTLDQCMRTKWGKSHRLTSVSLIRTYSCLCMDNMLDSAYNDFVGKAGKDTIQDKLIIIIEGKVTSLIAQNRHQEVSSYYSRLRYIKNALAQERIAEQIKFSEEQYAQMLAAQKHREEAETETRIWTTHTIIFSLLILVILHYYYNRKKNKQTELSYKALLERQSIIDANLKIISSAEPNISDPSLQLFSRIQQVMDTARPYLKEDFSINTLAELLNTNTTYISRAINSATNHSFPQWLAEYRNHIAIRALQDNPNLTINEVTLLTGHNTRETFSRQFKSLNGISFSDFKERISKNDTF